MRVSSPKWSTIFWTNETFWLNRNRCWIRKCSSDSKSVSPMRHTWFSLSDSFKWLLLVVFSSSLSSSSPGEPGFPSGNAVVKVPLIFTASANLFVPVGLPSSLPVRNESIIFSPLNWDDIPSTNFAWSELDINSLAVRPVAKLLTSKLPAYGILIDPKSLVTISSWLNAFLPKAR